MMVLGSFFDKFGSTMFSLDLRDQPLPVLFYIVLGVPIPKALLVCMHVRERVTGRGIVVENGVLFIVVVLGRVNGLDDDVFTRWVV